MKLKLDNGKFKVCDVCNREMNVNACILHTSSITKEECSYCHYMDMHMVDWKEDEENAIEPK